MSASNYLPPFTPEERGSAASPRLQRVPAHPEGGTADGEVTYADFLGDEVDD